MRRREMLRAANPGAVRFLEYPHGSCVFLMPEAARWFKTSTTGRWIYAQLEREPATIENLIEQVACHYSLPREAVSEPTRALVQELRDAGLATCERHDPLVKGAPRALDDLPLQQLWFNITGACNLRCPHCYVPEAGAGRRHAPLETAFKIIDEAGALKVSSLVISGGEPTAHPNLREVLAHASGRSLRVKLVTNATGPPDGYWDGILPLIQDLQVSLDGVREDSHDRVRGTGSYRAAVHLLDYASKRFPSLSRGVSFTPLPETVDELPLVYDLALAHGATYIHLNRPRPPSASAGAMDRFAEPAFFLRCLEEFDKLLVRCFKDKDETKGLHRIGPPPLVDAAFDPGCAVFRGLRKERCPAGTLTLCVDEAGDYYPCAALCRRVPAGANARDHTLGQAHDRIRESMRASFCVDRDPECSGCDFRYFCGGGCRAIADRLSSPDRACAVIRGRIERSFGKIIDPLKEMAKLGSGEETKGRAREDRLSEVHC